MRPKTHITVASLVAGFAFLAIPSPTSAVSPASFCGAIAGLVTDSAGIPQMGAVVLLYNHKDYLYQRGLTNERGEFTFSGLMPDLYSIRVTLASFVPAVKSRILVQPGMRSSSEREHGHAVQLDRTGLFRRSRTAIPDERRLEMGIADSELHTARACDFFRSCEGWTIRAAARGQRSSQIRGAW